MILYVTSIWLLILSGLFIVGSSIIRENFGLHDDAYRILWTFLVVAASTSIILSIAIIPIK